MTAKQILVEDEVRDSLEKLIEQILQANPDTGNLVLIGIMTRGAIIAKRIQETIAMRSNIEVKLGELDTRPYRDDLKGTVLKDLTNIPFSTSGKDVILVDDIISTGRTIRAALDAVIEYGRPKSIRTAVLIDRGHREFPITADYVGIIVPTSIKEKISLKLSEVDGGRDRAEINAH
jgi:pyrimidine operon attenuation protein / uracil phosphoribosyltransferase